ncbi:hypothetical protein C8Q74DRAFT_1268039 [Fomes fomentarius]|nr:hypothetical protein C8Q74DRAFT_1268039 [Fomes fomentarius]
MVARFKSLKDEFTEFVNGFSAWAKEREEADEEKVKQLLQDIRDLDEQIAAIETAMQVIGYSLGATIPATIALATLFPPAAPWILGIGCSIAGVEILSLTGLAIAKNILLNDKRQKEYEVQDLQNEIGKIKAARTQLEEKGQADLLIFTTNITAISKIWVDVHDDAQLIRTWLSEGAKAANAPEYMKAALDKGVKVYSNMAQYLKNYANGVTGTVQRLKA